MTAKHQFILSRLTNGAFSVLQTRPYGQLGGDLYIAGDLGLVASGAVGSEPHSVIGGALLFCGGIIFRKCKEGRDDLFAVACGVGSAGVVATFYPAVTELITTYHTSTPATIYALGMFLASNAFGAIKPGIVKYSRAAMGVLSAAGKAFVIKDTFKNVNLHKLYETAATIDIPAVYEAVKVADWTMVGICLTWLAGDCLMTKSATPRKAVRLAEAVLTQPAGPGR